MNKKYTFRLRDANGIVTNATCYTPSLKRAVQRLKRMPLPVLRPGMTIESVTRTPCDLGQSTRAKSMTPILL